MNRDGRAVEPTTGRSLKRGRTFYVRKADQDDLKDAICQGNIHEIPEVFGIGYGQETFRMRLEQDAGQMDDDINTFDSSDQGLALCEVGADDFGFARHLHIHGHLAPMNHQSEHAGVELEEVSRKDGSEITRGSGDEYLHR